MLVTAGNSRTTSAVDKDHIKDAISIFIGSMIIAFCSQLSLTVPFTSIPFSVQAHAVLFLSAVLGPKRAFICVALYLVEGISGLPVFSHGRSTLFHLLSPSGGYLLSYLPVSYFVGFLLQSPFQTTPFQRFFYIMIGNLMILTLGMLWFASFVGFSQAFLLGFLPFVLTDVIKSLFVSRFLGK